MRFIVTYGDERRTYSTDAADAADAVRQVRDRFGNVAIREVAKVESDESWKGQERDPLADLIAETARRANVPVDAVEEFARKVRDLSTGNGAQGLGGGLGLRLNDREVARAYPADGVTVGQVRDHLGRLAHAAGVRFEQANEFVNFITEGDYAEEDDDNYY